MGELCWAFIFATLSTSPRFQLPRPLTKSTTASSSWMLISDVLQVPTRGDDRVRQGKCRRQVIAVAVSTPTRCADRVQRPAGV